MFDVRTLTTDIFEANLDYSTSYDKSFDLLGRSIKNNSDLAKWVIIRDNELLFNIK